VLTWRHFFTKPITVQYPEERPYFSPHERGLHEFEPDKCIICHLCAKACPVDCIKIEEEGAGKTSRLTKYEIDYSKCLFCALCVDPCPVDCIHMGQQFDLAAFERGDHVKIDFMNGEGPWRTARTSAHPEAGLAPHLRRDEEEGP
jgi:NADH-quinone oxidoreductase subunit I